MLISRYSSFLNFSRQIHNLHQSIEWNLRHLHSLGINTLPEPTAVVEPSVAIMCDSVASNSLFDRLRAKWAVEIELLKSRLAIAFRYGVF